MNYRKVGLERHHQKYSRQVETCSLYMLSSNFLSFSSQFPEESVALGMVQPMDWSGLQL